VPPEWRQLLEAVLSGVPRLTDPLCRGFADVFDAPSGNLNEDERERIAFAKHCCRVCPAQLPCARWVNSLPRDLKPLGVTAGVLRQPYAIALDSHKLKDVRSGQWLSPDATSGLSHTRATRENFTS
jgi:hypothetical protein